MSRDSFIVTGGAGLIGCNIIAELNRRGHTNILVVDHLNSPLKERNLSSVKFRKYLDRDDFRRKIDSGSIEAPATVIHMGACSSTTEKDEMYLADNNFRYTCELCDWALEKEARFIYASSAATYGDGSLGYRDDESVLPRLQPLNPYGRSKQMFDMWALERGLLGKIVGLKYFNVYGPHEDHKGEMRSVVNKAYRQTLETGGLKLFKSYRQDYRDGEQVRDFVYVKDAARITLFFHDHPEVCGVFNCGTGKARTWFDLGKAVFAAMNKEPQITFIEMPESIKNQYQYFTQADVGKLRKSGYVEPFTSLEDGVRDYVENYMAR